MSDKKIARIGRAVDDPRILRAFQNAHLQYPAAVGAKSLYGVAFFGHGRPKNLDHKETTSSIWRGLVRKCLREQFSRERGE